MDWEEMGHGTRWDEMRSGLKAIRYSLLLLLLPLTGSWAMS